MLWSNIQDKATLPMEKTPCRSVLIRLELLFFSGNTIPQRLVRTDTNTIKKMTFQRSSSRCASDLMLFLGTLKNNYPDHDDEQ